MSTHDNAIYSEADAPAEREFTMDTNDCYEEINSTSKGSAKKHTSTNKLHLVVIAIMIALLLGTVGACIAFTTEIIKMKSEVASLEMESNLLKSEVASLKMAFSLQQSQNSTGTDFPGLMGSPGPPGPDGTQSVPRPAGTQNPPGPVGSEGTQGMQKPTGPDA